MVDHGGRTSCFHMIVTSVVLGPLFSVPHLRNSGFVTDSCHVDWLHLCYQRGDPRGFSRGPCPLASSLLSTRGPQSMKIYYYRPQRSCGQGNIFTPVCHSFCSQGGGEVCLSACWDTTPQTRHHPPQTRPPPEQTPIHPLDQTPPGADTHPPEQTPPGAGTHPPPPRSRHPPPSRRPLGADTHPPGADTHPLGADTHPLSRHPLEQAPIPTPLGADTHHPGSRHPPPGSRHPPPSRHPPEQTTTPQTRHPPWEQTTPWTRHPLGSRLQHTVYEWPVRILLECILVRPIVSQLSALKVAEFPKLALLHGILLSLLI